MKYTTPDGFRTALEQRLLRHSRETNINLFRLRKRVVFERLLARLVVVAPERWVLKGGLALDFRHPERARATVDMDLARRDDEGAASRDFRAATEREVDDFFTFDVERTHRLDDADVGGAIRYRARASLAGRRFEEFVIDVGFATPLVAPVEHVLGPDFLAFAGLTPVTVPVLSVSQHVAEKVHAYTRRYGDGQRPSSRVKDLIDLVLLGETEAFVADVLHESLQAVFAARATHPVPGTLPPPPDDWRPAYRVLADQVGLDPDLDHGYHQSARFLDPILQYTLERQARWDRAQSRWVPSA